MTAKRTSSWLVLALVALGCSTPAPFDPGSDCAKITYCGQCASRGACSWCGDPNDGAKGQCVAIGRSECSAPSAWAKTPDRCALPPADATNLASTAPSASTRSPAPGSPEANAAIRTALQKAFPSANVTDQLVTTVTELLRAHPKPPPGVKPSATTGTTTMDRAPLTRPVREKDHKLYLGQATHHRVKGIPPANRPMQSEFMLSLPMVRVAIPDKLTADNAKIATEIGEVDLLNDHLLGSIDLIDGKYGGAGYLNGRPERVELITPARDAHTRFGAIAVYMGYRKKTDKGPSFYLLEAGTATGDAKMIYFSPDMKPINNATSYYLPTAFVSMRNTYTGTFVMKPAPDEDEPDHLLVESRAPGEKDPYITVNVSYKRSPTLELPLAVEIIGDAAARVALVAESMGLRSAEEIEPVLAGIAMTLHWIEFPHYPDAGKAAPAAPAAPTAAPAAPPAPH